LWWVRAGDYLDPIAARDRCRLILADERAQGRSDRSAAAGTWSIKQMAADVTALAMTLDLMTLDLPSYGVLGHSFGAFLALQHAVDFPGAAAVTVVSAVEAAEDMTERLPAAELAVFEDSAHMCYVEEQERYVGTVSDFLDRHA